MRVTTKSWRWGKGSGIRIGSRWQLGSLGECISFIRGWLNRASEWCVVVMGTEVGEGGIMVEAISKMGVWAETPAVASSWEGNWLGGSR